MKRTARGFRIFGEIPLNNPLERPGVCIRVQEASLAREGPHVWLIFDDHPDSYALNMSEAKALKESLEAFLKEAREGTLMEGLYPDE